jgi:hypothetical protein
MLYDTGVPLQLESNIDNISGENIRQKPYKFNNTAKFKESITFEMIQCQMNLIKGMLDEQYRIEILPKNKLNLGETNAFKTIILNAKYKLIEYLGNINPSSKKSDIKKLKDIRIDCLYMNDEKFTTITTALIDILLESTHN